MSSTTSRTTPGKPVQHSASLSNNALTTIWVSKSKPPVQKPRNTLPAGQDTVQHQKALSTVPDPDISNDGPHRTQVNNLSISTDHLFQAQEARSSMKESVTDAGDVPSSSWTNEFNNLFLPTREETPTADPTNLLGEALELLRSCVQAHVAAVLNDKNVEQVNSKRDAIYIENSAKPSPFVALILPDNTDVREQEDQQRYIENRSGNGNLNVSFAIPTGHSIASSNPMQPRTFATPTRADSHQSSHKGGWIVPNATFNIHATHTHGGSQSFASLGKHATISATWNAHSRWNTPKLIQGTRDHAVLHYLVEWAQKVYDKNSAVALLQCPHPARAAAISQHLALHRRQHTPDIVTATFCVEPSPAHDVTRQIIPTLAYQICKDIPATWYHLPVEDVGVYERAAVFQLEELIIQPLFRVRANPFTNGTMKDVLIVIDGIDQVNLDWAAHLIELFVEHTQNNMLPLVKVLVTTSLQHRQLEALLSRPTVQFMSKAVVDV